MNIRAARKQFKKCMKLYGEEIDTLTVESVMSKAHFKNGFCHYNAAPGQLNLHTGEFEQPGKPVWKKFKYP
jgi:hypothetical protein